MDATRIIKFRLLTVLFIILTSFPLPSSANPYSVELKRENTLSAEAADIFRDIMSKPEIIWGTVTDIDIDSLIEADPLYFLLEDNPIELFAKYSSKNDEYYYVHYESLNNDEAFVSIIGDNVHIDLRTAMGKYQIMSISENQVAIVRYEAEIPLEPEYNDLYNDDYLYTEEDSINTALDELSSTPVIRVLFIYTSSALDMMSGPSKKTSMKNEVYRYINQCNESFANSNINARLQLAYIGPTIYNESSRTWDVVLNHFSTSGDGYLDAVHTLRNKYKADVCVLMVNKDDYCGEARTIKADANTAFCMIWPSYTYCGWRYSAIHEIGHLIGCRHNRSVDYNNTPYQYGHGYINCVSGNAWSTIMSYESSCGLTNYRILNWSNPNIYHNNVATGTTSYENNARVWNERASIVESFRTKANNIQYTSANINTDALYESIEAVSTITLCCGFEVQAGQTVDMNASNYIRFSPGTHIKSGSTFRAQIRSNIDNHTYPQYINKWNESTSETQIVTTSSIDTQNQQNETTKILRDGQLYIIREGRKYTVTGQIIQP